MVAATVFLVPALHAETISVAAAADLKFAMDAIVQAFERSHPGDRVEVTYGSSGQFHAQIQQGAPHDLFFSADIAFPRELVEKGLAASPVKPYAVGRLVLWSATMDASKMTLQSLLDPKVSRIAIANPKHAPYGQRAEEALRALHHWDRVESKLVFGENVSQAAQFVETGNAQVGIIALSLAVNPALAKKGGYSLIPDTLHKPLEQAFVITRRGGTKPLAKQFASYIDSPPARAIMAKFGFVLPGETAGK
ncbi:MAG: molybdate ABC transporter substrate-binding protein [Bryobacteraceae bacterium]